MYIKKITHPGQGAKFHPQKSLNVALNCMQPWRKFYTLNRNVSVYFAFLVHVPVDLPCEHLEFSEQEGSQAYGTYQ